MARRREAGDQPSPYLYAVGSGMGGGGSGEIAQFPGDNCIDRIAAPTIPRIHRTTTRGNVVLIMIRNASAGGVRLSLRASLVGTARRSGRPPATPPCMHRWIACGKIVCVELTRRRGDPGPPPRSYATAEADGWRRRAQAIRAAACVARVMRLPLGRVGAGALMEVKVAIDRVN